MLCNDRLLLAVTVTWHACITVRVVCSVRAEILCLDVCVCNTPD